MDNFYVCLSDLFIISFFFKYFKLGSAIPYTKHFIFLGLSN